MLKVEDTMEHVIRADEALLDTCTFLLLLSGLLLLLGLLEYLLGQLKGSDEPCAFKIKN